MSSRRARAGHAEVTASIKDRISGGLKRIKARMQSFAASSARVGGALTAVGGGSLAALTPLIKLFADFDDQMRTVKAVTGATDEQFKMLSDRSRELGRSTSFMAAEVAGAQVALGRAGFKPDQIDESIESVLALARATGTELPQAAGFGADVLRAFKLETSEMGRVADVLSVTANSSSQTLENLFESLKPVAPIAAEAGDSLEDLAAASGVLANNGIKGSLAGNSLGRAYKNLANAGIQGKLKELTGVDATDSLGNLKPLVGIIQEIGVATEGLGEAARLDAFEQLFGRGQVAALNLANASSGFGDLRAKLEDVDGAAKKTAAEMDGGIGGSIRKLWSAAEGVGLTIIDSLVGPIDLLTRGFTAAAAGLEQFIAKNPGLIQGLAIAAAAVTGVGIGLLTLSGIVTAGSFAVSGLIAVIGVAGSALAFLVSPIGLISVALISGVTAWARYTESGQQSVAFLTEQLNSLLAWSTAVFGGIRDAIAAGDWQLAAQILWKGLEVVWQTGIGAVMGYWIDFKSGIIDVFSSVVPGIRSIWSTITSGIAKELVTVIDLINNVSESLLGVQAIAIDTAGIKRSLDESEEEFQEKLVNERNAREKKRLEEADAEKEKFAATELQRELDTLVKTAAERRAAAENEAEEESKDATSSKLDELLKPSRSRPTGPTVADRQATQISTSGSFSLSQAQSFSSARVAAEQENLKANKRTATATEDMKGILEDAEPSEGLVIT